jgi:RNA polymerase sigma-70 factor (ECF subfamily)
MNENISRLQKMISLLGPLDKAMMLLYLDSKSYAEIAEVLDITETNVATRISRIKIRLKQQFNYLNQ